MSAEWVTAIATVGTFVVIAASAAAALFQLRHMRGSNQAPDELLPVRKVCNFMETFGCLVKNGIVDRKIACDLWGYVVLLHWDVVAPLVVNRRIALKNPGIFENFEYLAAISKAWFESHERGSYPANTARMPLPEPWPETRRP